MLLRLGMEERVLGLMDPMECLYRWRGLPFERQKGV